MREIVEKKSGTRAMDKNSPAKVNVGVVYSGISYQDWIFEEYQRRISRLSVCDLPNVDLSSYHILLFPRGTDQEMAYTMRDEITKFLDSRKIVISFGEVTKGWLPSCNWGGVKPEDDGPLEIKKKHPILKNLRSEDLHWHKGATGWCCHGHFLAPPGAEILVTNSLGDPVMYVDRQSTNGIILAASQLDAVCHAYGGNKEAKVLIDNILAWTISEVVKLQDV